MRRVRINSWLVAGLFTMAGAAACGDDDDGGGADGSVTPDADRTPDAQVSCEGADDCPEGGEVRLEYVTCLPGACPGGNDTATRITSFFMRDADSGNSPDAFPAILPGQCWDISADNMWPTAQGENPEYIDVGGLTITGGATDLTPPAGNPPPATDPLGRIHDSWFFQFAGPSDLVDDTKYSVSLSGSDTWDAQEFQDALVMPKAMNLIDPGLEAVTLTAGEDFTVTWSLETSNTAVAIVGLVGFIVPGMGPVVACPELNDGSITVPAAMVDKVLSLGSAGMMARQTLTHQTKDTVVDGVHRRVDMIAVWCYATPWSAAP